MADPTSPSPYSENKKFEPKIPVELNEPKSDEITLEELSRNDGKATTPLRKSKNGQGNHMLRQKLCFFAIGTNPERPTWVAIKGTVFDVSKNQAYKEKGQYHGTPTPRTHPPHLVCWSQLTFIRTGVFPQSLPERTPPAASPCQA